MYMTAEYTKAIQETAEILGGTMREGNGNYLYIDFEDGRSVGFYMGWNAKGKASVRGHYPLLDGQELQPKYFDKWESVNPTANISLEKAPRLIAKDVERRILPEYNDFYKKAVEHVKVRTEQKNVHRAMVDKVAGEMNCHSPNDPHSVMWLNDNKRTVKATAYSADVSMELSDLTFEQFKAVLDLVKSF